MLIMEVISGTDMRFERKISGRFEVRQRRKEKSLLDRASGRSESPRETEKHR